VALAKSFTADRPTVKERYATGKALRAAIPRASHERFERSANNQDPVAIIEAQAKTRLQELVPVRHARMLTSPFAFLRGTAAVMAADLAATADTGLRVQACGDAHVSNFGVFASAERSLVFAINDFDETLPGAWEWDVKRLAASATVAARFLNGDKTDQQAATRAVVKSYRQHMHDYAEMGHLDTWYATMSAECVLAALSPKARARAQAVMEKATGRTHLQVLDKMTDLVNDQHRIVEQAPYIVHETHTEQGRPITDALGLFLASYMESLSYDRRQLLSRYQVIDVARKVVGVGSVGTRCWVILLRGVDAGDPLFLQVKEAQTSVLAPYFKDPLPYADEGRRVVVGQRLIQGSPDILLGWGQLDGIHFYVRQLRDMKGGVELMPGKTKLSNFNEYCGLCGWALALAHAKSGDAAMIAGYVGKSDEMDAAMARFSARCADQNERDFEAFQLAARKGRIAVGNQ
jgi:uncharacterized protein (DUF2252 family)